MKARTNRYAVVKRLPDGSCTTICFAEALGDAQEKMRDLAQNFGGEYLVTDTINHIVLAFTHVKKPGGMVDFQGTTGPSTGNGGTSFPPARKGLS